MRVSSRLIKAAEKGDTEAQYRLATTLAAGERDKKNLPKAAYWYRKAAAKKHPEALYNLGIMHVRREVARGSKKCGLSYIERAADLGSWDAQWFLADAYQHGRHGLLRDNIRAAQYLILALGCRYGNAALALGLNLREADALRVSQLSSAFILVAARAGVKEALELVPPEQARKLKRRAAKNSKKTTIQG